MGLDMYLTKRVYVKNWEHMQPQDRTEVSVKRGGVPVPKRFLDTEKVSEIIEDVGYWRKANAVHAWFVSNCQGGEDDCKEHRVSREKLTELLKICRQIKENRELAGALLPTSEGFFFGDTRYSDWYFNDIDLTIVILNKVLTETEGEIYYQSSW